MAAATKPKTGVVALLAVLGACAFSAMVFTGSADAASWECERHSGNHCTPAHFGYDGWSHIHVDTYRKPLGIVWPLPGAPVDKLCVGARKPNGEERTFREERCRYSTSQHQAKLWPDPHSRPYAYWWCQHHGNAKAWLGVHAT